ncbi:hypothetical protein Sjap_009021 [Stephania japonica]|uniref:Uncharacterized protein n=1 Tax=Stephania japonica TaxID=461633 RepID=A0AAP0PBX3_9MAGN
MLTMMLLTLQEIQLQMKTPMMIVDNHDSKSSFDHLCFFFFLKKIIYVCNVLVKYFDETFFFFFRILVINLIYIGISTHNIIDSSANLIAKCV